MVGEGTAAVDGAETGDAGADVVVVVVERYGSDEAETPVAGLGSPGATAVDAASDSTGDGFAITGSGAGSWCGARRTVVGRARGTAPFRATGAAITTAINASTTASTAHGLARTTSRRSPCPVAPPFPRSLPKVYA